MKGKPVHMTRREFGDLGPAAQAKKTANRMRGYQSKAAGAAFEEKLMRGCALYEERGIASIEKTPEPIKQWSGMDEEGRFKAFYTKKAQGDFFGVMRGGVPVAFEAKSTGTGRIQQAVVTEEQTKWLDRKEKMGALCFVMVCMNGDRYFRVPWDVWKDMKTLYGRKYMTLDDLAEHEVGAKPCLDGWAVLFLDK